MPVYSLYSFHRTFIPGFEYLTPSGFISSFEYLTHCGPVSCGHVSLHIIIIIYFLRHFFSCHCYIIYKRFTSTSLAVFPFIMPSASITSLSCRIAWATSWTPVFMDWRLLIPVLIAIYFSV